MSFSKLTMSYLNQLQHYPLLIFSAQKQWLHSILQTPIFQAYRDYWNYRELRLQRTLFELLLLTLLYFLENILNCYIFWDKQNVQNLQSYLLFQLLPFFQVSYFLQNYF